MPGWLDKLKGKAEETLNDQEKMDRLKGKVQDTLNDKEKMARIEGKAAGFVEKIGHHSPPETNVYPGEFPRSEQFGEAEQGSNVAEARYRDEEFDRGEAAREGEEE